MATPSTVSHSCTLRMCSTKLIQDSINSFDEPARMPSSDFSWPLAIVMAAAEVKPAVTGIEMNCTRKPAITVPFAINIGPPRCIMNERQWRMLVAQRTDQTRPASCIRTEVEQAEQKNNESAQKR